MTARPYQLLPPLDEEQLHLLRTSIAKSGVLEPVVLDENGQILDGHHRVAIAEELGIAYPTRVERGLDEDNKRRYAITMNVARRQLSPTVRGSLVAQLRTQGLSIRKIAEDLGLPKSTVHHDLKQLSKAGQLEQPERITGGDGRDRPATRPAKTPAPAEGSTPEPGPPQEPDPTPEPVGTPTAQPTGSGCENCGGEIDEDQAATGYLRCGACDPVGVHYSTKFPDGPGPCVVCTADAQPPRTEAEQYKADLAERIAAVTETAPARAEPDPLAPWPIQVEVGHQSAATIVQTLMVEVLAIIAAVDLGEDLVTEQMVEGLQGAVDSLAGYLREDVAA